MSLVRINPQDHHDLRAIAKEQDLSMPEALHLAIKELRRKLILAQANAGYAALRADPQAWGEAQTERALWDRAELREEAPAYGTKPAPAAKSAAKPSAKKPRRKST